jgi:hypothetical protein
MALRSLARTAVEQVTGACVSALRVASCFIGEHNKALNAGGQTVDTTPGCIDENTTSTPPTPGHKQNIEHLAGREVLRSLGS